MSDHDIELLKLQIQREQMRADLFKWFVAFAWPFIIHVATSYIEHRAIDSVATKAAVVEAKQDVMSKSVISTDAITTKWLADKTGDPNDVAKAVEAQAKLEKMP